MHNRRQFLGCAGAAAALLAMPAAGVVIDRPSRSLYGLEAFKSLLGQRLSLREGGAVRVAQVKSRASDPRCEQFVVSMRTTRALDSGLYHLETAEATLALYLEAGGDAGGSTLAASVSRLRA